MGKKMGLESKLGLMVMCMWGSGRKIKNVVKESWFIQMGMFMKGNGMKIEQMEKVLMFTRMVLNILEM